jgi:alpha-tubulin suppressor-like RCC1 family protein
VCSSDLPTTATGTLAYSTTYTATISTVVKDLAGNALPTNYSWSFATGVAPDTTPPSVVSTAPTSNATNVAPNMAITATFSESMAAATINASSFTLKNGTTAIAGNVTYSGTTATFMPNVALTYLTAYTASITSAATDLAGNPLPIKSWTFTTSAAPDTTPPTVVSVTPAGGANLVPTNTVITAIFSEPLLPATITTGSFTLSNGVSAVSGNVNYSGTTATFTPLASLAHATTYTVTLSSAATDLAGNPLSASSWSFTTPPFPTWSTIAAGSSHSMAIQSDGTLWAWGDNQYGQLGDGTNLSKSSPTQIGIATNWRAVSAGSNHTVAIKTDGTLWAWGYNIFGQLGDGTTTARKAPVQIGTATDWLSVSAGDYHTVAIKTNGMLWAWGNDTYGQLGDGASGQTAKTLMPTQVAAGTTWRTAAAGNGHTVAIKSDGTLWAWGDNTLGQVGNGANGQGLLVTTPTQISVATTWRALSAGGYHTIATQTDGTLWAWGDNTLGEIGNGATIVPNQIQVVSTPAQIGIATTWRTLSAGRQYSVAIQTNGTLWAWGSNAYGQLGEGTNVDKSVPTQIGSAAWFTMAAGGAHTTALATDSTSWAWGYNASGQLGDGTTTDRNVPNKLP